MEGTDQRELFTETTKTTIVSDNGAVLKLNARVSPGQCLFLRNDQSGREILCKVLAPRQAGEAGYTELQFTAYDPNFWNGSSTQPAASVAQKPTVQKEIEAPMDRSAPAPTRESLAPIGDEAPTTVPEAPAAAPGNPLLEPAHAFLEPSNRPAESAAKDPLPDWDEARDAQLLAALAAMNGGTKPLRESAPKETKVQGDTGQQAATADVSEQDQESSNTASEAPELPTPAFAIRRFREFRPRKNLVFVGIAASLVIAAVLGIAWHVKRRFSTHNVIRPSAVSALPQKQAQPAATQPSPIPAPAVAQNPPAKTAEAAAAPAAANAAATRTFASTDQPALGHATHQMSKQTNPGETIRAKIISQAPPAIPPWAKGLDLYPEVQLDALIDEKGNVVEAKPISGPRLLQPAAQRAVALWIFEPALSNGKPIASRMVLTVQFQK